MRTTISLALCFALSLFVHSRVTLAAEGTGAFQPFPDMTFPSATEDGLIRLSDYRDKVVLLNWGRSDCGWTHRQTPQLAQLYEKYADRGLAVIGIMDENGSSISKLPEFASRPEISWPLAVMDQGEYAREILPEGTGRTPETFLITRNGDLQYVGLYRGDEYWQKLEATLEKALAEPARGRPSVAPRPPRPAPPFSLNSVNGGTRSLKDFAGRPLVVHFFTGRNCSWAGRIVGDLHREYGDRVGFVGIGYGDPSALEQCAARERLDFDVLIGDQETRQAWLGNSIWAVLFVSADGFILKEISRSLNNGIEDHVFPHYVKLLAEGEWPANTGSEL